MFPDFDCACLRGLCKQLTINFLGKREKPTSTLQNQWKFSINIMGQVLYSKFNATV